MTWSSSNLEESNFSIKAVFANHSYVVLQTHLSIHTNMQFPQMPTQVKFHLILKAFNSLDESNSSKITLNKPS